MARGMLKGSGGSLVKQLHHFLLVVSVAEVPVCLLNSNLPIFPSSMDLGVSGLLSSLVAMTRSLCCPLVRGNRAQTKNYPSTGYRVVLLSGTRRLFIRSIQRSRSVTTLEGRGSTTDRHQYLCQHTPESRQLEVETCP